MAALPPPLAGGWSRMIALARGAMRSLDLAVDFGTASVRVAAGAQPVRERRSTSGERRALAGGVVVDRQAAADVLRPILSLARRWADFSRLRVLTCAPSDASAEEKAALADCIVRAGASAVHISQEPMAAAIGAGVDVVPPYAKLLVEIGEGVTDCAVIRSAQVACSRAVRIGCADLRAALQRHIADRHGFLVSEEEAERLLRIVGVGEDDGASATLGSLRVGGAGSLTIPAAELRVALAPQLAAILGSLDSLLRSLPPPLSAEVIEEGIHLSGGGALLRGMPQRIARLSRMDVRVAADPRGAVLTGIRSMLPIASILRLWEG